MKRLYTYLSFMLLCSCLYIQCKDQRQYNQEQSNDTHAIQEIRDGVIVNDEVKKIINQLEQDGIWPNKILFVSDIDNTILKPWGGAVGSDQWFDWNMLSLQAQGKTKTQALETTLEKLTRLQPHVKVQPVDVEVVNLIDMLQKKGVYTLGLTARDDSFARVTLRQLKDLKIDLKKQYPSQSRWKRNFKMNMQRPARYVDGVIFCAGGHKGKALLKFLKTVKYKPDYVFFIDDKLKNVQNVQESLREKNIPATLIHYTETRPEVEQFIKLQEILAEQPA